jgi:lipid-A-disaccharide synthase
MPINMMIVAGEASGDIYGSLLASHVQSLDPGTKIRGVGGDRMKEAGVDIVLDSNDLSVVGFWEAIIRLGRLKRALEFLKREIDESRPDLLVLIDYPGMNLRLARHAKRRGVKVMYYVSPQVWAWGRNRMKIIKQCVDRLVVILPFEEGIYREEGIDATYVGHPLIDVVRTFLDREAFLKGLGIEPQARLVALLPGSRIQEVRQNLRPLIRCASLIRQQVPSAAFTVVSLPAFIGMVMSEIKELGEDITITTQHRYEAIGHSDLAITCSGTATLEATLLFTPMIVIYRLAFFSWLLGRLIVKVPYISLANLVAGEKIVPEFIQGAVNPTSLAEAAISLLTDDGRRDRMVAQLKNAKAKLGPGGATAKAAEIALSLAAG